MKKETRIFFTALMYFTRIRVPATIHHDPVWLKKSPKYVPLVGSIVGVLCSIVFLVFARFINVQVAILASMVAGLLITGAFHEDGFADVCDGFGGGWTKEKILLIMKDSRIGAFGAIGLIAMLGSKYLLLWSSLFNYRYAGTCFPTGSFLSQFRYFIPCLIAAHSISRLMPVLVIQRSVNVTDADHSKSKPVTDGKLTPGELLAASIFALIPFAFLPWEFLLAILPAFFATLLLEKYFKKWIGGYTGDCLGAIQQVSEIAFYLGYLLIWRLWTFT
jgi:adenosylcobinamide-GDP ribazoletransferase